MADDFDPYREALVVESDTIWPEGLGDVSQAERLRIEQAMHRDPSKCAQLEYVRLHTGFCRQITVTPEDLQRLRG